ncbi:unnamed protein product [Danaus chrysippus]|uniref:(African queen) hypothetical protein n=1 Tax=Danaus chrysippus TaxID=151541 RepID=A0A8J2W374_9NEOP|nr:unnamed protein product [Danaus chrysippus]
MGKRQRKIDPWKYEDQMGFLRPYMEMRNTKTNFGKTGLDETDMFFLSMSKAVKALPKLDQTKIKLDLHMAISQAEIRNIKMERLVKTPLRIVSQTVIPPSNRPLPEPSRVYYYHNAPTEINEFSPDPPVHSRS